MHITGRAAQFGRGVQQEVAAKLLNKFAECLENEISGKGAEEEPEPAAAAETGSSSSEAEPSADGSAGEESQPRRRIIQQDQEVEPLDLGEASRDAVVKRAVPVVVGVGALIVVIWLLRRRKT
jgi:hypothetical protein